MNFVYLSPCFPAHYQDFVRGLHQMGARVLGVGETPYDELRPELRGWMHEYYRVESLEDYDQVYRACGHLIHRHGRLDRIDSNSEHWLQTEARLRDDFNVPGFRSEQVARIKRKSKMKEVYQKAGIPVARGALHTDPAAVSRLAYEAGFPLIAKPDVGVGAAATYRLEGVDQLDAFMAAPPAVDYILEEFLSGELCSYDGLVNSEGRPVLAACHIYSSGILDVVEGADLFYYSERCIPEDLEELGRLTLQAFDVRQRFFHLEFFRTAQGLRAVEANLRAPGGWTTNMLCYANDIDIFQQWANVVCHDRFEPGLERPYYVGYLGRRGHNAYRWSHTEVVEKLGPLLVTQRPNEELFRKATGDHGYLVRSAELEPLLEASRQVLAQLPKAVPAS